MFEITSKETINIILLPEAERERCARMLQSRIIDQVFPGDDFSLFYEYYFNHPKARFAKVELYKNDQQEIVGFCLLFTIETEIKNKQYAICSCYTALLPEYRGGDVINTFFMKEHFSQCFYYLLSEKEVWLFCPNVTPASYYKMAKTYRTIYPSYNGELSQEIVDLMQEFGKLFHVETLPGRPLVANYGAPILESPEHRSDWENHPSPHVKYFLTLCPDYAGVEDGVCKCLLTLCKIGMLELLYACGTTLLDRLLKWVGIRQRRQISSIPATFFSDRQRETQTSAHEQFADLSPRSALIHRPKTSDDSPQSNELREDGFRGCVNNPM